MAIIGLLTTHNAEDWIEQAIKQALKYCDEVILAVGPNTKSLLNFKDTTLEISKKYKDQLTIIESYNDRKNGYSINRCTTLNKMISRSKLYKPGNWVWILDVDEFYTEQLYNHIKFLINEKKYDNICIRSRFFLIDMKHYLLSNHKRLFKIKNMKTKFRPTQQYGESNLNLVYTHELIPMFHYSLLTNPKMRRVQWACEYNHSNQPEKLKWLDEIYLKYNLEKEEEILQKSKELFGITSPWMNTDFKPDKDGKLFVYEDKHPDVIEQSDLVDVKDFRKFYD